MKELVSFDRESGDSGVRGFKTHTIKVSALLICSSICILREYQNERPNVLQIVKSSFASDGSDNKQSLPVHGKLN